MGGIVALWSVNKNFSEELCTVLQLVIYILGSYYIKLPGARPFGSDWDPDTVIEYSNYTNINPNNN